MTCTGQREEAARDIAELLASLAVENDVDGPLARDCTLAGADLAGGGIRNGLSGDLDRAEDVLGELSPGILRIHFVTGDERLLRVRDVRARLVQRCAIEAGELSSQLRGDPGQVARVRRIGRRCCGCRRGGARSRARGRSIGRGRGCGWCRRGGVRLVGGGIRLQHSTELELRRGFDATDRGLIGNARDGDDDVLSTLGIDFCLGHAGGIDALTDDRHGLVELICSRCFRALGDHRRQNDLGSTLEVEGQLGCPTASLSRGPRCRITNRSRGIQPREKCHNHEQPGEGTPGLFDGGGSCCQRGLSFLRVRRDI